MLVAWLLHWAIQLARPVFSVIYVHFIQLFHALVRKYPRLTHSYVLYYTNAYFRVRYNYQLRSI